MWSTEHLFYKPLPVKTSWLQPGQPSVPVSYDDFNFHLHEKFCPGLQG